MKSVVDTIFVGKDRQYNRRFLRMCSHHLVEPVACTPASGEAGLRFRRAKHDGKASGGWEKGQVENHAGFVRERFFMPRLRLKTYGVLNAWLLDKSIANARAHPHPEQPERTLWEIFEEERPKFVLHRGRFDGFHALPASVSKTCLARKCTQLALPQLLCGSTPTNTRSTPRLSVARSKSTLSRASLRSLRTLGCVADNIVIRQDGIVVAEHARAFGREKTTCDPWHYMPVLPSASFSSRQCLPEPQAGSARKPGALRHSAPPERGQRASTGCCRRRWSACAASSPCPMTATGRWRRSSPSCSPADCRRLRRPASRRCPRMLTWRR